MTIYYFSDGSSYDDGLGDSSQNTPQDSTVYKAGITPIEVSKLNNGVLRYTFNVSLNTAANSFQSVNYQIIGVGDQPMLANDFVNQSSMVGTLDFQVGEQSKILSVDIYEKNSLGLNKTFSVILNGIASLGVDPLASSSTSTITDSPRAGNSICINNQIYMKVDATYKAGSADSYIYIENGSSITTKSGNDHIIIGSGKNNIDSGSGNDEITLTNGVDTVKCGGGNDIIHVGPGSSPVSIDGGAGIDTLDFSSFSVGLDLYLGKIKSNDNKFQITATNFEKIIGSSLNDHLAGDKKNNILDGGAGDDIIYTGFGNDTVVGGEGDDTLNGEGGFDILTGGSGKDLFDFLISKVDLGKKNGKCDIITDFKPGEDKICLIGPVAVWQLLYGSLPFEHKPYQLRYTQPLQDANGDSYIFLQGDVDGDGQVDFLIKMLGITKISADDFDSTWVDEY